MVLLQIADPPLYILEPLLIGRHTNSKVVMFSHLSGQFLDFCLGDRLSDCGGLLLLFGGIC